MLEAFLFRFGPTTVNDDSDLPFPAGTPFKGVVRATNFITGDGLANAIGLQDGGSMNSSAGWLHFIEDNGFEIYIAKKPLRHSVTWQQIDAATKNKVVNIQGRDFTIELMTGALTDPTAVSNSNVGGEWNRYMYNVFKGEGYASIPGKLDWGSYDNAMLGIPKQSDGTSVIGSGQFCKEATTAGDGGYITRGRNGSGATTPILAMWYGRPQDVAGPSGNTYGWRPMLVLKNSRPLPPPTPFIGETTAANLITYSALKTAVEAKSGTTIRGNLINSTGDWLHYVINDKNVYVSKLPIMNSVVYTDFTTIGAHNGTLTITIGGKNYKVRWMTGTKSDANSEWNQWIYRIYNGTEAVPNKGTWATYTAAQLGSDVGTSAAQLCFCQGTATQGAGQLTRGGYVGGGILGEWYQPTGGTTNTGYGWRPVLEEV